MKKPKGGRGNRLNYTTIAVRVPEPVADLVNQIADSYRETEDLKAAQKTCTGFNKAKIREFYERWRDKSHHASPTSPRWQYARQMLEELEGLLE